jgi:hypothetical protein
MMKGSRQHHKNFIYAWKQCLTSLITRMEFANENLNNNLFFYELLLGFFLW